MLPDCMLVMSVLPPHTHHLHEALLLSWVPTMHLIANCRHPMAANRPISCMLADQQLEPGFGASPKLFPPLPQHTRVWRRIQHEIAGLG
jgi:hypothetical protein